jgi:hypothetical protein
MSNDRFAGDLYAAWMPRPKPISPASWLNDPRHAEFTEAYRFALGALDALAAKSFLGMEPEQVYLTWKAVETARAGALRRRALGWPRI